MKTISFLVFAVLAVPVLGYILAARSGWLHNSDETLKQRYANDGSHFITLDGVPIRYKDEGAGHPIILIHGAFGNLNMWDEWVEELKPSYRIIRFDDPPEGLSGPDPSGKFGHDRNGELLGLLADTLGIDKFALGGTSRGAVVAYRYTARNPDKVSHLILVNTPVLPQDSPPLSSRLNFLVWMNGVLGGYAPKIYWRTWLKEIIFFDPAKVSDELVKEYADFNNRVGQKERMRIVTSGAKRDVNEISRLIGSISAPTLIIASEKNSALALEDQRAMENMFASTRPEFRLITDGGHFLAIEKGEATGKIVKSFLDGKN